MGRSGTNATKMRVANAWIAVSMLGNCGGSFFSDFEMSAFHYGVNIDGALDFNHL